MKALVLRTCAADMSAHGGFTWPESGPVECPPLDEANPGAHWDPKPECGNGLHGALWGEGDGSLLSWGADARWLVVEVDASEVVDLGGKVKFPRGVVVHCGDRESATSYLAEHGGEGRTIIGGTATAGYAGTATAGIGGTATAGDDGTATAGDDGQIRIEWFNGTRRRLVVGYVGEDGIEPNVAYSVRDGALVRADGGES